MFSIWTTPRFRVLTDAHFLRLARRNGHTTSKQYTLSLLVGDKNTLIITCSCSTDSPFNIAKLVLD